MSNSFRGDIVSSRDDRRKGVMLPCWCRRNVVPQLQLKKQKKSGREISTCVHRSRATPIMIRGIPGAVDVSTCIVHDVDCSVVGGPRQEAFERDWTAREQSTFCARSSYQLSSRPDAGDVRRGGISANSPLHAVFLKHADTESIKPVKPES